MLFLSSNLVAFARVLITQTCSYDRKAAESPDLFYVQFLLRLRKTAGSGGGCYCSEMHKLQTVNVCRPVQNFHLFNFSVITGNNKKSTWSWSEKSFLHPCPLPICNKLLSSNFCVSAHEQLLFFFWATTCKMVCHICTLCVPIFTYKSVYDHMWNPFLPLYRFCGHAMLFFFICSFCITEHIIFS